MQSYWLRSLGPFPGFSPLSLKGLALRTAGLQVVVGQNQLFFGNRDPYLTSFVLSANQTHETLGQLLHAVAHITALHLVASGYRLGAIS